MHVKYRDATCQRNHWSKHKKRMETLRAGAKLRDEALFIDPPTIMEDCSHDMLYLASTRDYIIYGLCKWTCF